MPESLRGKEVLLVGGAGGLGAASARLLAAEGARVIVSYRSQSDRAGEFEKILQADITRAEDRASDGRSAYGDERALDRQERTPKRLAEDRDLVEA